MIKNIDSIKSKNGDFSWINITNPQKNELEYLRKKYKFNEFDLKDSHAKSTAQRPKFYIRNDYCFLILQFPLYNRKTRTVDAEEIDFFIGKNFLITTHCDILPPIIELFNLCSGDKFYSEQYLNSGHGMLLYEIIVRLQEYCYPIMDHVSLDIKSIENNIFEEKEREMVKEILLIKRNVLNFRKIMEAHKDVLKKVSRSRVPFLNTDKQKTYYNDLVEHTKDIWDILNGQKETIEALENTNSSLISFKLNDVMRTLTIFSVVVFPLTLLATIFSMRVEGMPLIGHPDGFWIIVLVMLIAALSMFLYFKNKKWI